MPRKPLKPVKSKAHPAAAIRQGTGTEIKLPWWLWNNPTIKAGLESQMNSDSREMDRIRAQNLAKTPPIFGKHTKSYGTTVSGKDAWAIYDDGSSSRNGKFYPAPKKAKKR